MTDIYEIIEKLCSQKGISGRECPVAEAIKDILSEYESETDALGNLIITVREAQEEEKTLLFEAHMDRIGLVISHITEDGFLHAVRAGGTDPHTLMASEVVIAAPGGSVTGVVGLPFPYPAKPHNTVADSEREMPTVDEMFIDVGFEEPNAHILLGNEAVTAGKPFRLLGTRIAAPALDDRGCCAALIRAAELLKKEKLGCGLKLLFSTREEIGCVGVRPGAFGKAADYAVAVDTNSAVSPDVKDTEGTEIGKGVQIDIAPVLDNSLIEKLIETAKAENIDYQLFVDGKSTGTDADGLSIVERGIKTALLSLPIRFMHHPTEVADLEDIEKTALLLAALAKGVR